MLVNIDLLEGLRTSRPPDLLEIVRFILRECHVWCFANPSAAQERNIFIAEHLLKILDFVADIGPERNIGIYNRFIYFRDPNRPEVVSIPMDFRG
ncbi:hypothetical protein M433DRAFT_154198 [Acidomyces richmondensis BFW]|nr:MAG: hypothetical protein FE78DRAFT_90159 [Acidomyces sp. 'richmondensis']KYG45718.1 hypothetical protein M433DRAFT_154198 [Acidomyces richmondensis BFW]